jgi:hypothetical protein
MPAPMPDQSASSFARHIHSRLTEPQCQPHKGRTAIVLPSDGFAPS